jgi:hypothetical protein
MPSPFLGIDPFIEDQEWNDFYISFNVAISETLARLVQPRYVVRIVRTDRATPEEQRDAHLLVREVPSMEIVTVIETLSPPSKRASSDGREQYLATRDEILQSRTNLIEIDLLRGGKRLPVIGMPPGDYFAIVSRGFRRPRADVFSWSLRQTLPTISIPLKKGEPEVPLDLQAVLATVYERADYPLTIDYEAPLNPSLNDEDAAWMRGLPLPRRKS